MRRALRNERKIGALASCASIGRVDQRAYVHPAKDSLIHKIDARTALHVKANAKVGHGIRRGPLAHVRFRRLRRPTHYPVANTKLATHAQMHDERFALR